MRKYSLWFLICLMVFHPMMVCAANPLDTDAKASLTLHYTKEGIVFPDLKVQIHRVAEAAEDGTFELILPFSSYPVNIHDITEQAQWTNVTTTLSAYIVANQVVPEKVMLTNADGIAQFSDLETGLYLVREAVAEHESGTYLFHAFMIYLPTPLSDGSYNYEVSANPKCASFVPKTQYTVTKLWRDKGNRTQRPKEVVVDIYKDGVLQETQVLSGENNWSYTWCVSGEDHGQWTVVEHEVPDAYKVSIQQNGSVFSIVNTRETEPTPPPQTGDTFSLLPWILAMCISGFALVLLCFYGRRRT